MLFHALTRKLLPGRPLQTMWRPGARPRLEVLEDRTVTSVRVSDLPRLLAGAPAVRVTVIATDEIEIPSGDLTSLAHDGANATVLGGPALEKLLEDIQKLETSASVSDEVFLSFTDLPIAGATSNLPITATLTLLLRSSGTKGQSGHPLSPVPGGDGGGSEAERSDFPTDAASILAQPNPPGSEARTDKNPAQPGTDSNVRNATDADPGRTPQTQPALAPEVLGVRGTPTTNAPDADGGNRNIAAPVDQSRITGVTAARPSQDYAGPAGAETNEVVPPRHQADTAAQAGGERLPADLPDGLLLQRFVAGGEQTAFTALVERYEGFVLGICQRVLGDSHAALDAFQATFLVLAQNASLLDKEGSLAGWLWKVAYHIALRLRTVAARQRRCEKEAANRRPSHDAGDCPADLEKQEMLEALGDELQRLPEKYRVPLVLCYFEGQTHAEAARTIGMPRGSMAKRVAEGLRRLRERLVDRGFMF
jgi:RNA polymerase sigma factor (sigma-70 family)